MPADTPACGDEQATGQRGTEAPTRAEFTDWQARSYRIEVIQAGFSFCLLFLGCVGAWYAKGQLQAMREQNDIASKQIKAMTQQNEILLADQRPWLIFSVPDIEPLARGKQFSGQLTLHNYGKTPATLVAYAFNVLVETVGGSGTILPKAEDVRPKFSINIDEELKELRERDRADDELGRIAGMETIIPPGDAVQLPIRKGDSLTNQDLTFVELAGRAIFVLVYARYVDTTGDSHETWATFIYDPKTKQMLLHTQYGHAD
jgi:hypothetical protein